MTDIAARAGHNSLRYFIVTNHQQWLHACAVRSICFMEEHGSQAEWLFDGNDYQATHMIAYAGEEPIGSSRVRWFKDFAKIERTAFRKDYRSIAVLKDYAAFVFDHIARKGYTRVITHAGPKYARLWRTVLGFKSVEGKEPAFFVGHEPYYEVYRDLEPSPNAITLDTPCNVLYRIEGRWDEPDRFEVVQSAP